MAILHHNFIKSHSGIGGLTPADAAGTKHRQVADVDTKCHSRLMSANFHGVACNTARTLPHVGAKRPIWGLDFAKNHTKRPSNVNPKRLFVLF